MFTPTHLARAAAAALGLLLWCVAGPLPASASCAGTPLRSAAAFTGVVTATPSAGRVATVRTDAGVTVEVRGTPGGLVGASSVDRSYEVGGRYEFHPVNDASPYEDNACTATQLLSPGPRPGPALAGGTSPAAVLAVSGVAAAGVVLAGIVLRRRQRVRRRRA